MPHFSLSSPFITLGVSPLSAFPWLFSRLSGLCHSFSSAYSDMLCNTGCFTSYQLCTYLEGVQKSHLLTCDQIFLGLDTAFCTRLT